MHPFSIEQTKLAYGLDFAVFGAVLAGLIIFPLAHSPVAHWPELALAGALGLVAWTVFEYVFHRFVLHGIKPFSRWHAEHHSRPHARIGTPTVVTGAVFLGVVFVPAWHLADGPHACAVTFGVICGYMIYSVTHHAIHHWPGTGRWLAQRKRWHGLHHRRAASSGHYGVTSPLWDHVFCSHRRRD